MRTPLHSLRRQVFLAIGVSPVALAFTFGCHDGTHDDVDVEFEDCADVPQYTPNDLANWNQGTYLVCGPVDDAGSCPALEDVDGHQYLSDNVGSLSDPFCGFSVTPQCGPERSRAGECCYEMDLAIWCEGRPFTVDGDARVAEVVEGSAWGKAPGADFGHLTEEERGQFAAHWIQVGLEEHASIASFSRFILELMAMGAPPDLIAGATRAMQDEIGHARLAFGVAKEAGAPDPGPGALDISGALGQASDPTAIVVRAVLEGCVNETVSAAHAAAAAVACQDPALRKVLTRIAADESRHAALAWRFVRWAMSQRPSLAAPVQEAFNSARSLRASPASAPTPALQALGVLSAADLDAVTQDTIAKVILPAAAALLGQAPAGRPRAEA